MRPGGSEENKRKRWNQLFCRHKSRKDKSGGRDGRSSKSHDCFTEREKELQVLEEENKKVLDKFLKSLNDESAEDDFVDITEEEEEGPSHEVKSANRFFATTDGRIIYLNRENSVQVITVTGKNAETLLDAVKSFSGSRISTVRDPDRPSRAQGICRCKSCPSFHTNIQTIESSRRKIFEILGLQLDTGKIKTRETSVFDNPGPSLGRTVTKDENSERLLFSAHPPPVESILRKLSEIDLVWRRDQQAKRKANESEAGRETERELTKYSVVSLTTAEEFDRQLRRLDSITLEEKVGKWLWEHLPDEQDPKMELNKNRTLANNRKQIASNSKEHG